LSFQGGGRNGGPSLAGRPALWGLAAAVASVANSLSFLASGVTFRKPTIAYNAVHAALARAVPALGAAVAFGTVIASATFGLYHLTYAPPWNTLPMAVTLSLVWLGVTAVYLLTGSLWAAAVFNTVMAVIGFVLNSVRALDQEPLAVGVLLDGVSVAAIIVAAHALRRTLRA